MLNRSASLAMSTSILKALPGKLDIKRHSHSILYLWVGRRCNRSALQLFKRQGAADSAGIAHKHIGKILKGVSQRSIIEPLLFDVF